MVHYTARIFTNPFFTRSKPNARIREYASRCIDVGCFQPEAQGHDVISRVVRTPYGCLAHSSTLSQYRCSTPESVEKSVPAVVTVPSADGSED